MKIKTKKCKDCGVNKKLADFYKRHKNNVEYPISYCLECMVIRSQDWQNRNRKKYNEYQRKHQRELRWMK